MSREFALFDLVWADRDRQMAVAAELADADWARLDRIAGQHRLRPLLQHRMADSDTMMLVPCSIQERWRRTYRRAALLALRQQTELARIARLFEAQRIEAVALKGGAIVWQGWIDPALRPMRDLDILVEEDQALEAHALLRQHGFVGNTADALPSDKHLPGLVAPETRVIVEVHTRLAMPRGGEWDQREARFRHNALERAIPIAPGGRSMNGFGATDTLLHIIVHGALDHQFNNGPLMLADIALLAARGAIDWRCFWTEAETLGVLRACQLSLRLAERYAYLESIDWADLRAPAPADDVVDAAATMMLVDMGRHSELGWAGRLAESDGGGANHFRAMLRRRWLLIRASSAATGTAGHLRHIGTMMMTAGRYMTSLLRRDTRTHVRRTLKVARWLRGN